MKNKELEKAFELARRLARGAGDLLVEKSRTSFEISKKGRVNLVTEADLAAEELIVSRILEHFPHHGILAEERGGSNKEAAFQWVIDPLDGTTNFAHGYPVYCVSIGLECDGRMVAGVVHNPILNESFTAIAGEGAFLNGEPIHVSTKEALEDCLLCTGFSYQMEEIESNLRCFNYMMKHARSVRRDGSAALDLCNVACGRFDGFWELSLHAWDVAAGSLILEEAGGRVSRFDSSPASIRDRECLATNGRIHDMVSEILTAVLPSEERDKIRQ
jgi:myo-inositol-1(or 4)-monophosphatase